MSSATSALRIQTPTSSILESFARAAVVEHYRLAGHRVRIMKRHGIGRGPQPRRWVYQRVGTERILRVERLGHRNEVDRRLRPTLIEAAMPEREVSQRLDLPDAVFAHIVVLVDAALPPGALRPLGRLVQTGLHGRAAAYLRRAAVRRHVDDHLQLRMIQQPAIARSVMPLGELCLKALDIQTPYARLALVYTAKEPDIALIREQVHYLVVLRLVDEIAVAVLNTADLMNVLLDRELVFELVDARCERGDVGHCGLLSCGLCLSGLCWHDLLPSIASLRQSSTPPRKEITNANTASARAAGRAAGTHRRSDRRCNLPLHAKAGRQPLHEHAVRGQEGAHGVRELGRSGLYPAQSARANRPPGGD